MDAAPIDVLLAALGEVESWESTPSPLGGWREEISQALSLECGCSEGMWCDAHTRADALACERALEGVLWEAVRGGWSEARVVGEARERLEEVLLAACVCHDLQGCREHCAEDAERVLTVIEDELRERASCIARGVLLV